ncbi:MAG: DUF3291 domain-containing protein [Gammaproteobacteria bacterium]|nr:DUF3291 domain-containing protein [Gammaproteobacteria bacterium]
MSDYQLAQLNIARMKADLGSPVMKGFVDQLDTVNAIADKSPGFVWRLQTEEGDATDIDAFDDSMLLVNMSVWESVEHLKVFVYETFHLELLKQKREWFNQFEGVFQVLWWIPAGTEPTLEEAKQRLAFLQENGASEYAFNF